MMRRSSYLLIYIAPVAMIFGFWAVDGLLAPFPERIAASLLYDPIFPLAVAAPLAAYVILTQREAQTHVIADTRFRTSVSLLPIPVYIAIIAFFLGTYRFGAFWPPAAERAIPYIFGSPYAVAAIFVPVLCAAILAYYSLAHEAQTGVIRSTVVLLSILLLAAPGLVQFLILRVMVGRVPGFNYLHSLAVGIGMFIIGLLLLLRTFGRSRTAI